MAKSKKNPNKPKFNLTVHEEQRNWTWTIQQNARNCAGRFSILSPAEKFESENGLLKLI